LLLSASAAFALVLSPLQADLVIFKDGYTLHGKVKRQTTGFLDPASGTAMQVPKLSGFFMVDDDARRVVFSFRQVEDVDEKNLNADNDIVRLNRRISRLDNFHLPALATLAGVTPWDDKWERVFKLNTPTGRIDITQRLTALTPYYLRADSLRYFWSPHYLTREFDPEMVRALLYKHPDLQLKSDSEDANRRFRVYRFLAQAGWFAAAEKELDAIAKDFPEQKEKVETARDALKKLWAAEACDEVLRGHQAGRHVWAQEQVARFPLNLLEEKQATRLQALKTFYEKGNADLAKARRFLHELPAAVTDLAQRPVLTEAAGAILAELNYDTVNRLEAFLGLAQQAERDRKPPRTPEHTPEQLLALAVSGWLLGGGAADAKVDEAVRLWRTRQMVQEYQNTDNPAARQQKLAYYQKGDALPFDEVAQLIRQLPPPDPWPLSGTEPHIVAGAWMLATGLAAGHLPFQWPVARTRAAVATGPWPVTLKLAWNKKSYYVQLPPEYHLGRAYPVLFALHNIQETMEVMLRAWGPAAAQYGYILVAPEWEQGARQGYEYSPEEHAAVVDVLRELRRRFQVDSDRVFLSGLGEGGNMAYDVGLAHPDLFAGVLPMGGRPRFFAKPYWKNAQYLPFYVVDGDQDGENPRDNRKQFEQWIPRGYPALYVEYKGRGLEWFSAELPMIFDWMGRKKRATAVPDLGKNANGGPFGEEFQTMRPTDNHFYWVSVDEVHDRNTNTSKNWNPRVLAANVQGQVNGNHINLNARGFKKATVWLAPGMIDFEKPLTVQVNLQVRWSNRKVTPSLQTLLEDLYQRGDRQQLFLAKVEFPL
jgi:predicted esterase